MFAFWRGHASHPHRGYLAHSPLICCLSGLQSHIYRRANPYQISLQGLSASARVRSSFQVWPFFKIMLDNILSGWTGKWTTEWLHGKSWRVYANKLFKLLKDLLVNHEEQSHLPKGWVPGWFSSWCLDYLTDQWVPLFISAFSPHQGDYYVAKLSTNYLLGMHIINCYIETNENKNGFEIRGCSSLYFLAG